MSRLALGSAQFGLPYGIANRSGQVSPDELARILARARVGGMDTLDTAIAYGESELRLGQAGVAEWKVVSKLPTLPVECGDVGRWVEDNVSASLQRLGIGSLYGLLLHRSANLVGPSGEELYSALQRLKSRGVVHKIGASVYDPEELDALAERCRLDLVQAPFNIVDRRLESSGWLQRLRVTGVELHTRSVFLQGLLLMSPEQRPAKFDRWAALWALWERWLGDEHLDAAQACLGFVLRHPQIDRVVVGVDSVAQLSGLLERSVPASVAAPAAMSSRDPDLINPSQWRLY